LDIPEILLVTDMVNISPALVGLKVGESVGGRLGDFEGALVGTKDGVLLGEFEGATLGASMHIFSAQ
jgi:hypothetical protein